METDKRMLGDSLSVMDFARVECFVLQLHKKIFKCLKQTLSVGNQIPEVCEVNISLPPQSSLNLIKLGKCQKKFNASL